MSNTLYELPKKDCNFDDVYNASNQEFACSPKLANKYFSSFSGLLINAPDIIVWPNNVSLDDFPVGPSGDTAGPLRFMVAGLGRFQYKMLGLEGDVSTSVLMVAVDNQTGKSYSGRMPRPDYAEMPPPLDDDTSEQERSDADQNALLTSHFNFDLVHDLGIPIANASYTVYATLGEFKSNVLSVTTRVEK